MRSRITDREEGRTAHRVVIETGPGSWQTRGVATAIEPFDSGLLDVGDGNHVYWERVGNLSGKPILHVHGGPGSGSSLGARKTFDPQRYLTVVFDQRGCGRSTPHAADPATEMTVNTTRHLIADMERLREHLGIERWGLYGGSWGSTLSIAYAQDHPDRVSDVILVSVTTTSRAEIEWLYHGVGRFFPEQWEVFVAGVPEAVAPTVVTSGNIFPVLAAYSRRMAVADPTVRARAARDWVTWEDAVISLESNGSPGAYSQQVDATREAMVRICSTYFTNCAWIEDGALLRNMHTLAGIPARLIHGQFDLGGPVHIAHDVHDAWAGSQLSIVAGSGHTGSTTMRGTIAVAIESLSKVR